MYRLLDEEIYQSDPVQEFIPDFHGEAMDVDPDGKVTKFIRISNLLQEFRRPKVMDVKLGIRTFLESECSNAKLRPDLFDRMVDMYPWEVTADEHTAKAITKHRWMTVRDKNSTIGPLGYRIDGVAGHGLSQGKDSAKELAKIQTNADTRAAFRAFAEVASSDDLQEMGVLGARAADIAESLRERLHKMRKALEESAFVAAHEFIGSSVLLVADSGGRTGVFWIDFAKTHPAPQGRLTHRTPWIAGNHEDGIILGMERLAKSWEEVSQSLRSSGIIFEEGPHASFPQAPTETAPISAMEFSWALKRRPSKQPVHHSQVSLASRVDGMPATLREEPGCEATKAAKLNQSPSKGSLDAAQHAAKRWCFGCFRWKAPETKLKEPLPDESDEGVSSIFVESDEEAFAYRRSGRLATNLLSDANLLSSLPSFSGAVTDAAGRVRQDAETARRMGTAAVSAAAEAVGGAVVEGGAIVRTAGRRSTRGLQEVINRVAAKPSCASSQDTGGAGSLECTLSEEKEGVFTSEERPVLVTETSVDATDGALNSDDAAPMRLSQSNDGELEGKLCAQAGIVRVILNDTDSALSPQKLVIISI